MSGGGGGPQRSVELGPVGLVHPGDVAVIRHVGNSLFGFVCSKGFQLHFLVTSRWDRAELKESV